MKAVLAFILLAGIFGGGLQTISRTNHFSREAAKAYKQQDFAYAIAAYEYLLNDLKVDDDQIRLNLAHSYYRAEYLEEALREYQLLINHPSQRIRALATLQLGNVAALQKKFKRALSLYRSALIAEPGNESARYNYELLKKYLDKHPELIDKEEEPESSLPAAEPDALPAPPPATDQDTPSPKKSPDNQGTEQEETDTSEQANNGTAEGSPGASEDRQSDNNAGEQEKAQPAGKEKGDLSGQSTDNSTSNGQQPLSSTENISEQDQKAQTQRARLQQMNLTPEKAQMLLDAMRDAELQYIQQLPRKATRKSVKSKPDW